MRGQKSRADNSDGWIPRCTPRKSVCPALRQGAQRQVGCFGGCVAGQRSFFLPGSACNIAETVVYLINCTSDASPSSSGLGHRVFIPATRVRLPLEMPFFCLFLWNHRERSREKRPARLRQILFARRACAFTLFHFLRRKKWDCSLSGGLPSLRSGTSSLRSSSTPVGDAGRP